MLPDFVTKCLIFLKAFPFEVLSILVFFTLIFHLPVVSPDGIWWIAWAKSMKLHGLTQIYAQHDVLVNYFPATLYVVKLWSTILDLLQIPLGRETVYTFKIFPMIFDLLTVLMAYRVAKKFQLPALSVFVGLTLNIAFHYNSYIWGQLDSVYTFCIFLSLYFAATKKISGHALFSFVR